jgi:hypothetical protein
MMSDSKKSEISPDVVQLSVDARSLSSHLALTMERERQAVQKVINQ